MDPPRTAELSSSRWGWLLLAVTFVAFFHRPIFTDQNFIYRDAGHFYYPYFKLQTEQWLTGQVPLWNPHENGGEPLLGNPTASVFYPGKIIFFLLPYGLAYKWYLLGHVALAMATTYHAARSLRVPVLGAVLSSLAYSLAGFTLFQIYNIVFLVGAAWLPLSAVLLHRLIKTPVARDGLLLAVVLALQILGGDPEIAMLELVFGAIFAGMVHYGARAGTLFVLALGGVGAGLTSIPTWFLPAIRSLEAPTESLGVAIEEFRRQPTSNTVGIVALFAGLLVVVVGRRRWLHRSARGTWMHLALASVLAGALAAVQILPSAEFSARSGRASPDVPEETAAFSLHAARLLETLSPHPYGKMFPIHARWFPWRAAEAQVWNPTLYMGLAPFLIAMASMQFRRGSTSRRALTWLVLLSLFMAMGKFGNPLTWMNGTDGLPKDPLEVERGSRIYGDVTGLYWLAEQTIPGFRSFRYPSKIMIFTTFGLSLLAGLGIRDGRHSHKRAMGLALAVTALALLACIGLTGMSASFEAWSADAVGGSDSYGPFQAQAARMQTTRSLLHSGIVALGIALILAGLRHRPSLLWLLPLITSVELALAQYWLLLTDDQETLDRKPLVVELIENHVETSSNHEPYRIHRSRLFEPPQWRTSTDEHRVQTLTRWERATAQPKYAIPAGMSYAKTEGTMTLYDVEFFFAPWVVPVPPALQAESRGATQLVYYPRTGYNLWNTRFFVLPRTVKLDDPERGTFTFRFEVTGKPLPVIAESAEGDYIVLENTEAFPRAWIVHEADLLPAITSMRQAERNERMQELLYRPLDAGLPLWNSNTLREYPLRQRALVEYEHEEEASTVVAHLSVSDNTSSETEVRFEEISPTRRRASYSSSRPGLLVIAEAYYPGWSATVDGEPAQLVRTNRAMQGVLVPAGAHQVELSFRSKSFERGAAISLLAASAVAIALFLQIRWAPGR